MKIEPETEIDKLIARHWPQRWDQANDDRKGAAKRRNRLRRQWQLARMPPPDVMEKTSREHIERLMKEGPNDGDDQSQ